MLKVLLVDDEPFIIQGLKVLVDWQSEGFEVFTAADGREAYDFLSENKVDLIIADIKMPVMTGLELLQAIRKELKLDTYFVILSGYAEFSYAQEALRYNCTDYILKPVEKEGLLSILGKVTSLSEDRIIKDAENEKLAKAYLDKHIMALLNGKFDVTNTDYICKHVEYEGDVNYVSIQLDTLDVTEEMSDEEKKGRQRKLYLSTMEFLKDNSKLAILDVSDSEKIYDVGFVFFRQLASDLKITEKQYIEDMYNFLANNTDLPITILVGKHVSGLTAISKSYGTVNLLRSLQGFREKKNIYYYEDEYQISDTGILLYKNELDDLIKAVELNEQILIRQKVDAFYTEMQRTGITKETMDLNVNYLLFQLIHLASEQDSEVNQEEILRLISENTFEEGTLRGSKVHLTKMACEYGEYLSQLRKNVSKGVLAQIEDEVKKNYASNLTLKELSEKYYVNSAYLGQLFRKKYGCSFKDYLNAKRMEEAATLLKKTDMKIYQIAEAVGYKDVDYFVNKFIEAKGCTPAKYRKQ